MSPRAVTVQLGELCRPQGAPQCSWWAAPLSVVSRGAEGQGSSWAGDSGALQPLHTWPSSACCCHRFKFLRTTQRQRGVGLQRLLSPGPWAGAGLGSLRHTGEEGETCARGRAGRGSAQAWSAPGVPHLLPARGDSRQLLTEQHRRVSTPKASARVSSMLTIQFPSSQQTLRLQVCV